MPPDFFPMLGRYIDYLRARDYAERTISMYADAVCRAGRLARKSPIHLTAEDIDVILAAYAPRGPAKGQMIRALKSFYAWAEDRELLVSPVRGLSVKKIRPPEAPALSRDELRRLCAAAATLDPRAPWTIVLAAYTGARLGSLCAVLPQDIKGRRIHFREAKGSKPYSVPLGPTAYGACQKLLELSDYSPPKAVPRKNTLLGVGPGTVWKWVHQSGELAGIKVWPHLLRHTFATRLAEQGTDPDVWRILMNHSDLSQYPRYVHTSDKRLMEAVKGL